MKTIQVKGLKLYPEFYCTKNGKCTRKYACVNPIDPLEKICGHIAMKALTKLYVERHEQGL